MSTMTAVQSSLIYERRVRLRRRRPARGRRRARRRRTHDASQQGEAVARHARPACRVEALPDEAHGGLLPVGRQVADKRGRLDLVQERLARAAQVVEVLFVRDVRKVALLIELEEVVDAVSKDGEAVLGRLGDAVRAKQEQVDRRLQEEHSSQRQRGAAAHERTG